LGPRPLLETSVVDLASISGRAGQFMGVAPIIRHAAIAMLADAGFLRRTRSASSSASPVSGVPGSVAGDGKHVDMPLA